MAPSAQAPQYIATPLISTPSTPNSQPSRDTLDYQPARPSPLVLAPPPAKFSERRQSSETIEKDERIEEKGQGQDIGDSDTESRGRACKGKRYKEIIAENGLKSIKKERKVRLSYKNLTKMRVWIENSYTRVAVNVKHFKTF